MNRRDPKALANKKVLRLLANPQSYPTQDFLGYKRHFGHFLPTVIILSWVGIATIGNGLQETRPNQTLGKIEVVVGLPSGEGRLCFCSNFASDASIFVLF